MNIDTSIIGKNGKAMLLAYDQGFEHGPTDFDEKSIDPSYIMDIARSGLFTGVIFQEGVAAKYYANIVLPFGAQVSKALETVSGLDINMIAPSHGLIWRSHIKDIIALYKKWANNVCEKKAVIVYDTMWHSTEKMAYAIKDVFEEKDIPCEIKNLQVNHISDIMTSILQAKYICVGSSTLNNGMLPTVSALLTYMKGLAPKNRVGIAFGSYGWGGQSIGDIENILEAVKFELPVKGLKVQWVPDDKELAELKNKIKEVIK